MKATLWTKIFGIFFLVIGIGGFLPFLAPVNDHGMLLLGIFQVNATQNLIHLVSAAVAFAALKGDLYASNYFRVFGVVYALVAAWGISAITGGFNDSVLFGLIHVNAATEILHIAIAAVSLYIGFVQKPVKA